MSWQLHIYSPSTLWTRGIKWHFLALINNFIFCIIFRSNSSSLSVHTYDCAEHFSFSSGCLEEILPPFGMVCAWQHLTACMYSSAHGHYFKILYACMEIFFNQKPKKNYYYKTKPTITNALSVTDPPHLHPYFPIKLTRTCTTHMGIPRSRRLLIDPRVPILDTLIWTFTQTLYCLLSNQYYTISCRRCWSPSVNSNCPPLKNRELDKTSWPQPQRWSCAPGKDKYFYSV